MKPHKAGVKCVVLASGSSQRFGGNNKLHEILPCGQTLIQRTVSLYLTVFEVVNVVVRPEQVGCMNLGSKAHYISNDHADAGMSQSIVSAIKQLPDATGWLIALGDMPYIDPSTVQAILIASSANNVVQPQYNGRAGHPVYFGRTYSDSLQELSGDVGAREVIDSAASVNDSVKVSVNDPHIHWDIDYPRDIRTEF